MHIEAIDFLKLFAAMIAGALIGLEREIHGKTAGFRTNIMICIGAALFTVLSVRLAGMTATADPARIAAQIVTGVGFLGAGAILHLRRDVVGLTTAATIWVVASLGMAFGAGAFVLGAVSTLLTAGVLFALGYVEKGLEHWRDVSRLEVEISRDVDANELLDRLARQAGVQCRSVKLNKLPGRIEGRLKAIGSRKHLDAFHRALMDDKNIQAMKRV